MAVRPTAIGVAKRPLMPLIVECRQD